MSEMLKILTLISGAIIFIGTKHIQKNMNNAEDFKQPYIIILLGVIIAVNKHNSMFI